MKSEGRNPKAEGRPKSETRKPPPFRASAFAPCTSHFVLLLFTIFYLLSSICYPATLTIDADHPGPKISPTLYGIFFEEINCAGDGGIYGELIRNRSFEDSDKPDHWSLVKTGTAKGEIAIETERGLSAKNPRSLKLTITSVGNGRVAIANDGYWGIPLTKGESCELSLNARSSRREEAHSKDPKQQRLLTSSPTLIVSLERPDGKTYASKKLTGLTADWKSFKLSLTPNATDPKARLVISATQPGTLWLDNISLFPKKTWKNRPNGLRPDLAQMLSDLKPAFMRFPGGCWVEGDRMSLAYRWKQTISDVADRRNQYNIWQYYSTHGLGYHEYLQLCKDLGAEPLYVVNCGMSHKENVPMDQLGPWVQDALDAIEYANGPATSQWGAVRAKNGHPAPFHLQHMEIGNENGGQAYHERYAVFYKAIKDKYPYMKLVADVWQGVPKDLPLEILDEHYYNNPNFFFQNANRYDTYDRNGPKIYVGEYAVTQGCGQGNLCAALGEAAFMTGMERNSDVVVLSSYAPLFANVNYKKWNPDLINFNSARAYGTPSYYVQKMFSENRGDVVLPVQLQAAAAPIATPPHGAFGLGTWETQSEYKDIKVTHGNQILFESGGDRSSLSPGERAGVRGNLDSGTGGPQSSLSPGESAGVRGNLPNWRIFSGDWQSKDDTIQQTATGPDLRIIAGDPAWRDCTITLKARKLGGKEGFLVLVHVQDDNNFLWWNIGGWANSKHSIEQCVDGAKSYLGRDHPGKIETGRWYDLRIELKGPNIQCFLDGQKVNEAVDSPQSQPLYTVASRVESSGDIILKTVNPAKTDCDAEIQINGVKKVHPTATITTLTSPDPADENSLEQPLKVAPTQRTIKTSSATLSPTLSKSSPPKTAVPAIHYKFPPNSVTVLRLKTEK